MHFSLTVVQLIANDYISADERPILRKSDSDGIHLLGLRGAEGDIGDKCSFIWLVYALFNILHFTYVLNLYIDEVEEEIFRAILLSQLEIWLLEW